MANNKNQTNDTGSEMNRDNTQDFEMERDNEGQKGGATAWDTDRSKTDQEYGIGESDYSDMDTEDLL